MKREPQFSTEADLCDAFMADARRWGWTPYPETATYDILLVAIDGTQIGVHAKLKFNMKVLAQAIGDRWNAWQEVGPDFRAVLTGDVTHEAICVALGLQPIHRYGNGGRSCSRHNCQWSACIACGDNTWRGWHYWNPAKRCTLPEYVPDVAAGASAPAQLTDWKIRALKLAATSEVRGYITRADFKRNGVDPRRWNESNWMVPIEGQPGAFKVTGRFAEQHPTVYPQVLADIRDWLATSEGVALTPAQASLDVQ